MTLRRFHLTDAPACHAVFHRAVHEGAADHYTARERAAWAPRNTMPDQWPDRLADQITWVSAPHAGIDGFITLNHDGHLDLFYVTPETRRSGLATELYKACLNDPRAQHLNRLYTEASHLSRRFLEKKGWQLICEQTVERFGVEITNFQMETNF